MQTFLPYPNIRQSALILDAKIPGLKHSGRAYKQVIEASQIIDILIKKEFGIKAAWENHPAVKMWEGYLDALCLYFNTFYEVCCFERKIAKPIKMAARYPIRKIPAKNGLIPIAKDAIMPPWFGRSDFHAAHRSKLLEKLPEYYSQFNWLEKPGLPYVWK